MSEGLEMHQQTFLGIGTVYDKRKYTERELLQMLYDLREETKSAVWGTDSEAEKDLQRRWTSAWKETKKKLDSPEKEQYPHRAGDNPYVFKYGEDLYVAFDPQTSGSHVLGVYESEDIAIAATRYAEENGDGVRFIMELVERFAYLSLVHENSKVKYSEAVWGKKTTELTGEQRLLLNNRNEASAAKQAALRAISSALKRTLPAQFQEVEQPSVVDEAIIRVILPMCYELIGDLVKDRKLDKELRIRAIRLLPATYHAALMIEEKPDR